MPNGVTILIGDCRDVLRTLPSESVHCVVTSPPYWGLRDYGCDGQIGLEATLESFVGEMISVFRQVRRVLRADGTLWLNLGDSYAGGGRGGGSDQCKQQTNVGSLIKSPKWSETGTLGAKQLSGSPWRVAFALQADGWYLRQDIIWSKPNPMPESVRDRCTKAHEYLFLLSKSEKYYYDQDAILEDCSPNTNMRISQNLADQIGSERAHAGGKTNGNMKAVTRSSWKGSTFDGPRDLAVRPDTGRKRAAAGSGIKNNDSFEAACCMPVVQRNKRSVWTVGTEPFSGAHFATFPPALIEPCIKAGCPMGGVVLDPFGGAGTAGLVADRLQRNAILIELNPEYAAMAEKRIRNEAGMMASVSVEKPIERPSPAIQEAML